MVPAAPPEKAFADAARGYHQPRGKAPTISETDVYQQPPVITADRLTKRFGDQYAVNGVTFSIPPGLIFGYVGPSGSGKTTTMKLLLGLLRPTEGEATVLGLPPVSFDKDTRKLIGYMPQFFALYPGLTVRQNLHFSGRIYGFSWGRRKRMKYLLDFVELTDHARKLAGNISGGMQRRLSLAATLLHDPQLVFLDEPTAGVDPVLRRKFWDEFRVLQGQGRTLFVTTQYVSEVENCDLVGIMRDGILIAVDTPDNLRRQAYGGETLTLEASQPIPLGIVERMSELTFVKQRPVQMVSPRTVKLVVDDASTAIPELLNWAQAQGLNVLAIEPSMPIFEDVFVELIRKSGEAAPVTTNGRVW
jgi:ABC-2 type transport system ATP-binding protein